MSPLEVVLLGVAGVGATLVLGDAPWFRRRPLSTRLHPYAPPAPPGATGTPSRWSPAGEVLAPLVREATHAAGRVLGITQGLDRRLQRAGRDDTPASFRLRQLTHSLVGLAAGGTLALLLRPGSVIGIALVLGVPALAVLVDEQSLNAATSARARSITLELPVVAEQLAILVGAGSSLPAALARLGRRGRGVVAHDLQQVSLRLRSGVPEDEALAEWGARCDVDAVRRLVAVLAMHREAGDLGRLIANEARSTRAESHRELVESIERRSQLVWIPVTVATLVPGLLFLAVPFISALSQVTGGT